jgi:hypothetical protein
LIMGQDHVIRKQEIVLTFSNEDIAEDQWESFLGFHKSEGHKILSDLFDEYAPDTDWVRIDKINLDLGVISSQKFREDYIGQLKRSVEKVLSASIRVTDEPKDLNSVWKESIIHYLKYGTILWETLVSTTAHQTKIGLLQLLEQKIIEQLRYSETFSALLADTLKNSPNAMQRWFRQFSSSVHDHVQRYFASKINHGSRELCEKWSALIDSFAGRCAANSIQWDQAQTIKWRLILSTHFPTEQILDWIKGKLSDPMLETALIALVNKKNKDAITGTLESFAKHPELFVDNSESIRSIPEDVKETIKTSLALAGIDLNELRHVYPNLFEGGSENTKLKNHTSDRLSDADTAPIYMEEAKSGISLEKQIEKPPTTTDNADIYIANAGLVLLSPFIAPFFSAAGIDTDQGFADDRDASIGVHILQMLATGVWNEEEPQLTLNKIFCGRTPDWAPIRITDMLQNAISECDDLLNNVIVHWAALKNTSPEGLRETFLKREGKLRFENDRWELFVEYKTADILLQSLPWTFSVIKLPWMQYPIYINW